MRTAAALLFIGVISLLAACGTDAADPDVGASDGPLVADEDVRSLTTVETGETTTVAPTTTIGSVPPTGVTAADLCAGATLVEPAPEIDTDLLPEISGAAYSRTRPGLLYVHNDSGNLPRLFGIGEDSTVDFAWTIDGALFDWEDLAVAGAQVYAADFGDNLHIRPTVRILRIDEPAGADATIVPNATWSYAYENTRFDAETLIVEPDGSEAVIVTKGLDAPVTVFRLTLDDPGADDPPLPALGTLDFGPVTAGDVTPDGRVVGLRTLDQVLLWDRPDGTSIAETVLGDGFCEAPVAPERQGEAFAFHPDGRGYTTLSERDSATRNDFRLPEP